MGAPSSLEDGFKDRKTGLVVFGILFILAGCFCALGATFGSAGLVAAMVGSPDVLLNARMSAVMVLLYLAAAVALVWVGIGSTQARRWARALALVLSAFSFVVGVQAFAFQVAFMPRMLAGAQAQVLAAQAAAGGVPQEMQGAMKAIMAAVHVAMLAFTFLAMVVVPAAAFLLYRSPHVKATCERADPVPRWTDQLPLPVLAVAVALWAGAGLVLLGLVYGAVPVGGGVITGLPAAGFTLVAAALPAYVGWLAFRRKRAAWPAALALGLVGTVAGTWNTAHMDLIAFYRAVGFSDLQIERLRLSEIWADFRPAIPVMAGAWGAVWLVFLLSVRRHFAIARTGVR